MFQIRTPFLCVGLGTDYNLLGWGGDLSVWVGVD